MRFSVVMPVKNEANLLCYSLPSIYLLEPNEVILVMEPNEATLKVAKNIAGKFSQTETRMLILTEATPNWRNRHAYARRKGFMEAKNDTVLTTDVDKIVDPNVKQYLHLIGKNGVGLISFGETSYPFDFKVFVDRIIQKFYGRSSFMGLYAFSKKAWLETESLLSASRIFTSEDTHLHEWMKRKYRILFVTSTKNINLRPKESKTYQFLMGVERRRHGSSLLKVLVSSFLHLRPLTVLGFLQSGGECE